MIAVRWPSVCVNKSGVHLVGLGIDLLSEDIQNMFPILRIDVPEALGCRWLSQHWIGLAIEK